VIHSNTFRSEKAMGCHMSRQSAARRGGWIIALAALSAACGAAPAGPVITTLPAAAAPPQPPAVAPEVASYDVGLMFGGQLSHDGLDTQISSEALIRGLRDALGGRAVSAEERDAALRFVRDARDGLSEKNRGLARQFLEHNGREPGIVTMPSGLQYRVLAAGEASAKSPLPTDQVTVRYRATLADGTEFDRSDAHDRAATFRVNSVFKGWQQAFLTMKPGAKWQLFVPPELGYGNNSPPMVPPGALLVYDLELLKVEPAAPIDPEHHRP
jgi:FKBP-type peptidyl-prolyl cis-trans isomerase FklB